MDYFLLADLETTGLDPERCRVIEVAARLLVPGREVARYHGLCVPPDQDHRAWETTALYMHRSSGLLERAGSHGISLPEVDEELRETIDEHVSEGEPLYLMGNSVHFDRSFIARHMPRTMSRLHYRQLDVTSVRLWHILMSGEDPYIELPKPHRAWEDIENSLKQAVGMWKGR